jgi:hypothetical protein
VNWWDRLESPPDDLTPRFLAEPPDGRKDWPEIARQQTLFEMMQYAAPKAYGFAVPNAGKRNPARARREGIRAGVFDTEWHAPGPLTAYIEFKGYDASGRAGTLSNDQIRFGNRMVGLGIPCACFFSPSKAVEWLRAQGFPVREVRDAA